MTRCSKVGESFVSLWCVEPGALPNWVLPVTNHRHSFPILPYSRRMRSEAGDLSNRIDGAVLCVPTLSAEQKAWLGSWNPHVQLRGCF